MTKSCPELVEILLDPMLSFLKGLEEEYVEYEDYE